MAIEDVVKACIAAGFEGGALVRMVAIAGAESGWSASATNDTRRFSELAEDGLWTDPSTGEKLPRSIWPEFSVGAFQINLNVHGEHTTPEEARDYGSAAEYAMRLYQESGFSPWSTNASLDGYYLREAAIAIQREETRVPDNEREEERWYFDGARSRALLVELASMVTRGDECYVEGSTEDDFVRVVVTLPMHQALPLSAVLRSRFE